jgi:translation initiation factor 3 subunit H
MAAPSMAAALAASLPSQAPAPAPAATNYDSIPQWMSKVIDIEAEIPLTSVQLDGMVRVFIYIGNSMFYLTCVRFVFFT